MGNKRFAKTHVAITIPSHGTRSFGLSPHQSYMDAIFLTLLFLDADRLIRDVPHQLIPCLQLQRGSNGFGHSSLVTTT